MEMKSGVLKLKTGRTNFGIGYVYTKKGSEIAVFFIGRSLGSGLWALGSEDNLS